MDDDVFSVYADDYGNKLMIERVGNVFHGAKVSNDTLRIRRLRSLKTFHTAAECQDSLDKYADKNGLRYVGRLNQEEIEALK